MYTLTIICLKRNLKTTLDRSERDVSKVFSRPSLSRRRIGREISNFTQTSPGQMCYWFLIFNKKTRHEF